MSYTKAGLITLFAWLLWGDFCFTLMETVVPAILPLKLRSLESSNWLIGAIMTTLPGIFNATISPWVSFKSDRYRSKWGRRIPFIFYSMPFLTVTLVLIGYGDMLGVWIHGHFFKNSIVGQASVVIVVLAFFAACFDFFNMFVATVYWYLFSDVVPENLMSRFMSYFRLVGMVCSVGFNFFVLKYAESHMRTIYLAAACLYFAGFGIMCFKVREREYPPPNIVGELRGFFCDIRVFIGECYSIPYYWDVFFSTVFSAVAGCVAPFSIFFLKSLDLSLDWIGKINAGSGILTAVCLVFVGGAIDKWHPVRVYAYFSPIGVAIALNSCVWLFADGCPSAILFFCSVMGCVLFSCSSITMQQVAALPRALALFPRDRFGQFCGAETLLRSVAVMCGGVTAGFFIDFAKHFFHDGYYPYRFIAIWQTFFLSIAFVFTCRVYRVWRRLGADERYKPPTKSFSVRKLLLQTPPVLADGSGRGGVNRQLAWVGLAGFAGIIIYDAIFLIYFVFFCHHTWNTLVFLVQLGVAVGFIPLYLWLLRFLEKK
ncbi:MAG: hypothetical protein PHV34_02440 [Verrucomicrobiae bacterium]|nr:hypothetical protein [Verrucomicrobiae bacterium]